MKNKRTLAKYIVEGIGKTDMINLVEDTWDDVILRILVEFEEEVECLPFDDRSNDVKGGKDEREN